MEPQLALPCVALRSQAVAAAYASVNPRQSQSHKQRVEAAPGEPLQQQYTHAPVPQLQRQKQEQQPLPPQQQQEPLPSKGVQVQAQSHGPQASHPSSSGLPRAPSSSSENESYSMDDDFMQAQEEELRQLQEQHAQLVAEQQQLEEEQLQQLQDMRRLYQEETSRLQSPGVACAHGGPGAGEGGSKDVTPNDHQAQGGPTSSGSGHGPLTESPPAVPMKWGRSSLLKCTGALPPAPGPLQPQDPLPASPAVAHQGKHDPAGAPLVPSSPPRTCTSSRASSHVTARAGGGADASGPMLPLSSGGGGGRRWGRSALLAV